MLKPSSFLIPGLCAAGLLSGYAAKRLGSAPGGSASRAASSPAAPGKSSTDGNPDAPPADKAKPARQEIPHVRSTETVESLLAPDDGARYSRLAAWMADASEQDIAAYWAGYQAGKRSNDITDLVFLNWTRVDPQAAIAATAGGKDEHYAWWAWASHDPKGALAAAIAANQDRVNNVAWGIGEFHPDWMRQHFNEIPESGRSNAMSGFRKWDDTQNPLESLKFMKEQDMGFDQGTFKALVQKDPWAALDWIKENPSLQGDRYGNGREAMDLLLATMGRERPEDLERLAAQTPSGEMKRKMDAALFENLLATDPAAAIEQAKATAAPLIAAERFSKIGLSLIKTDPEKAFEMAETIMATTSGKLGFETKIEYGNGSSSWGGRESGASELIQSLLAKDPARVVEMAASQGKGSTEESPQFQTRMQMFNNLASQWSQQDLVGYTNWVNQQKDPAIHDAAAGMVINQLNNLGQFSEALDWAMSSEKIRTQGGGLFNTLYQWSRSDLAGARQWLESANLPESEKASLTRTLELNDR